MILVLIGLSKEVCKTYSVLITCSQVPLLTDGKLEVQVSSGSGHADFDENYHVCK